MKHLNKSIIICLISLCFASESNAQLGQLEAVDGIVIGNSADNTNGLIRYTGNDFEGRDGGVWKSFTSGFSPWLMDGSDTYFDQGKVGIGNDNPLVDLHITGINEMLRLSGTSPWLSLREEGQTNYAYYWMSGGHLNIGITDDKVIKFNTNSNERMRVDGSGNIGIGTLAPLCKLHINEDGEAIRIDGTAPWLSFYDGSTYLGYLYHTGADMSLFNRQNANLNLGTNNGVRMSINPNGNVAIGALTANAKLDVRGSAIFNDGGADEDFRIEGDDEENLFFVNGASNRVGIGTSSPSRTLDVAGQIGLGSSEFFTDGGTEEIGCNGDISPLYDEIYDLGRSARKWGNVWAVNGTIQTSDKNLKKNIEALPYGLKEIMALKPVKFQWKDSHNKDYKLGLIAQEVLPILSEVVKTHHYEISEFDHNVVTKVENENLGVYYSDIIPVLINGIKEQQALIQNQDSELKTVKKELADLRKLIMNMSDN
jgi:hypothetical protein